MPSSTLQCKGPGVLYMQGVRRETPVPVGGIKDGNSLTMAVGVCSIHTAGPDLPSHPNSQEV